MSYAELSVGDYVVHATYGIGLFEGIETVTAFGATRDYITIKYAGTDKLFVPCDRLEMIGKYIGDRDKDGKVKLSVPCMLCPKPHNFTVSNTLFFGRDVFLLPCPYSDINICFMGDTNKVKAELSKTELELLDMLEKSGIEGGFEALHAADDSELLPDPQIYDIIMFVIRDLEAEGKIFCRCEKGEGEYEAEVFDYGIKVTCKKCGASQMIPTDSLLAANAFLNADSLHLE